MNTSAACLKSHGGLLIADNPTDDSGICSWHNEALNPQTKFSSLNKACVKREREFSSSLTERERERVCVCAHEREGERKFSFSLTQRECMCVCVCVHERERERERKITEREREFSSSLTWFLKNTTLLSRYQNSLC